MAFAHRADGDMKLLATSSEESKQRWATLVKQSPSPSREGKGEGGSLPGLDPLTLRAALLDFIADFANWDNSTVPAYLETSRALTQAAHEALGGAPGTRPLVVDPFCGGGSIPLEALRVGADAFASDLNPIPVLLNKVVLEYIPKYGQQLADEVRKWGEWIKKEAEKELACFYPKRWIAPDELSHKPLLLIDTRNGSFGCVTTLDIQNQLDTSNHPYTHYVEITESEVQAPTAMQVAWGDRLLKTEEKLEKLGAKALRLVEETPIAYLWARTIQCEGPGCGAEVPLIRSLWLAKKKNRSVALRILTAEDAVERRGKTDKKRVEFAIVEKDSKGVWQWRELPDSFASLRSSALSAVNPDAGTVKRGSATCPCCGYTTPVARVREQLKTRHGGANDARMMCVVTTRANEQGRFYHVPTERDLGAIRQTAVELDCKTKLHTGPLSFVPDEKISLNEIRRISVPIYGIVSWGDMFTQRQLLALTTLAGLVGKVCPDCDAEFAAAVKTMLALAVNKQADLGCALTRWKQDAECPVNLFGRQAIGMVWDFAEAVVTSDSSGSWASMFERTVYALECGICQFSTTGQTLQCSATRHALPSDSADAVITDPPYYDAVPYAHLSDFFYVWLRRSLQSVHGDLFTAEAVPKDEEIVVDRPHELSTSVKGVQFYERELTKAFSEGRRILRPNGIGTIVFASKTTASWEAILKGVVDAGWIISGSWPIDTEMEARVAAQGQARLASSVHLVCRPRENPDGSVHTDEVGDWRDVLAELPRRIHEWMPRLAEEGVVGADAIFACLGPALEIFSRYSRVEKASGEVVPLKDYLESVWAAVSHEALSMIFAGASTEGFEPDARLTAMWLWTLNSNGKELTAEDAESAEEGEEENEDENGTSPRSSASSAVKSGFILEYDAARKIAQGLGAHLEQLTGVIEVKGDKARLLPVAERTKHLFGKEEASVPTKRKKKKPPQKTFFDTLEEVEEETGGWGEKSVPELGNTVLDRIHQSMILFAAGRSEALKRFLIEDGVGRDARYWRLAQALSALYPPGTDEKRWVDGVLARKKGLGF
ncbi:MAG: hypothetical protein WBL72_10990 [Thermoguttaceae bacterium]